MRNEKLKMQDHVCDVPSCIFHFRLSIFHSRTLALRS